MSAAGALCAATVLAGCGTENYFAGRSLPPSKLLNRVVIAVQNPSAVSRGALDIVDAYYDIRSGFNGTPASYTVAGFSGALPISIENMPEQQLGAVYDSGDGGFAVLNYQKESVGFTQTGLNGFSSSIFLTRNQNYTFAASQQSHVFTIVDNTTKASIGLSLPGVYRVSVNPGGSVVLVFVENSNNIYYPVKLSAAQTIDFSGGSSTWPKAAVDCEPLNAPLWCLFQAQSPDHTDAAGYSYGAPLAFDRPVKAVFSTDGGTAYVLNCGPECGGSKASITALPVGPMIFLLGQQSGALPTASALVAASLAIPGGASNALVDVSTMYVTGQQPQQVQGQTLFAGNLTVVNLTSYTAASPIAISDGEPGTGSRMLEADDNTLWIAMQKCNLGVRAATGQPYGCLTMFNIANNAVTMIEPYIGDATGIAAVTGLHKIYTAEGGQVYIFSTVDGTSISNQFVAVTGTAYDVAYMDGLTDANNTVY